LVGGPTLQAHDPLACRGIAAAEVDQGVRAFDAREPVVGKRIDGIETTTGAALDGLIGAGLVTGCELEAGGELLSAGVQTALSSS
jgi:hypothetical protein